METESLIQQAQQLIDTCPDINVQANTYDIQQLKSGKKWCCQVAMWTKTMCEHSRYNSKVHEFMNWHIMAFQAGNRIRKAYDDLIGLLLCGYKLIEQKTPSDKQIVGRIIDEQNDTGPMPVAEFVTHANKRIKAELKNPFNGWQLANFNSGGLATSNPVIERILERLDQAQRWLAMNILRLGINCKEMMSFQQNYFSSSTNTKWTQAYNCLEEEFVSPEAIQASPWAWLGVNMLGYCIPPSHDVFESLPQNIQRSIAVKVTSANIGPTPNYIKVICEALKLVSENTPNKASSKKRKPVKETIKDVLNDFLGLEHNPTELTEKVNKRLLLDGYEIAKVETIKTTLYRLRKEKK